MRELLIENSIDCLEINKGFEMRLFKNKYSFIQKFIVKFLINYNKNDKDNTFVKIIKTSYH